MQFRYDFGQDIDLTRFRKSANYYLRRANLVEYEFFLTDFKVLFRCHNDLENQSHQFELSVWEAAKIDGVVVDFLSVKPFDDSRLKQFSVFQNWFPMTVYLELKTDTDHIEDVLEIVEGSLMILRRFKELESFL